MAGEDSGNRNARPKPVGVCSGECSSTPERRTGITEGADRQWRNGIARVSTDA
jgi:hypothetical protein